MHATLEEGGAATKTDGTKQLHGDHIMLRIKAQEVARSVDDAITEQVMMRGVVARLLTDVFNDLGHLDNAPVMLYLQNKVDPERTMPWRGESYISKLATTTKDGTQWCDFGSSKFMATKEAYDKLKVRCAQHMLAANAKRGGAHTDVDFWTP